MSAKKLAAPVEVAPDVYTIIGGELDSILGQLKECTHYFVNAWALDGDFASFEEALVKLHAARRNLETCVEAVVLP